MARLLAGLARGMVIGAVALLASLAHAWAAVALYYSNLPTPGLRTSAAAAYALLVPVLVLLSRHRFRALLLSFAAFAIVAVWWSRISPRTGLAYPPETAEVARADIDGNRVTIHNVRNFDFRSSNEFIARWETRTYDLAKLRAVDLGFNYPGVSGIPHVLTCFSFTDGSHVALSIEQRREAGEPDGLLQGLFKQFELAYIWADERDVIRLRTHHRREDVFLHRVAIQPEFARQLMLSLLRRTNQLHARPEFYNTLVEQCANPVLLHASRVLQPSIPFWKRPVLTGKFERRGFDQGFYRFREPTPASWPEAHAAAQVNARAEAADPAADFSDRIRTHLPPIEP